MTTHAPMMFAGGTTIAGETVPPAEATSPELPAEAASRELPAPAAREVRTDAGRYCRAVARDEAPHHGTGEVTATTRRVWAIAFGLAARRRYDLDSPLAEIARTVATAGHDRTAAIPAMEAEMLLRAALGEDVPAGELDASAAAGIHLLLFAAIADELALTDDEVDDLIAEAEDQAGA